MFTETFTGTNDVQYTHVYFLALTKDASKIQLNQTFTASQKREVSAVNWKSFGECKATIRPHYTRRLEIIQDIERAITTFETLGI